MCVLPCGPCRTAAAWLCRGSDNKGAMRARFLETTLPRHWALCVRWLRARTAATVAPCVSSAVLCAVWWGSIRFCPDGCGQFGALCQGWYLENADLTFDISVVAGIFVHYERGFSYIFSFQMYCVEQ